jgi:hypothetical protein
MKMIKSIAQAASNDNDPRRQVLPSRVTGEGYLKFLNCYINFSDETDENVNAKIKNLENIITDIFH